MFLSEDTIASNEDRRKLVKDNLKESVTFINENDQQPSKSISSSLQASPALSLPDLLQSSSSSSSILQSTELNFISSSYNDHYNTGIRIKVAEEIHSNTYIEDNVTQSPEDSLLLSSSSLLSSSLSPASAMSSITSPFTSTHDNTPRISQESLNQDEDIRLVPLEESLAMNTLIPEIYSLSIIPSGKSSKVPVCIPSSDPSIVPSSDPSIAPTDEPTAISTALPSIVYASQFPSIHTSIMMLRNEHSESPSEELSIIPSTDSSSHSTELSVFNPEQTFIGTSSVATNYQTSALFLSLDPTVTPSEQPSTLDPTVAPSGEPSAQPTPYLSLTSSSHPSVLESMQPSVVVFSQPSHLQSGFLLPSLDPTLTPSEQPSTLDPTVAPSEEPSAQPTPYLSLTSSCA